MLATVSVDVAGARNNPPPIAQNVRFGSRRTAAGTSFALRPLYPPKRTLSDMTDMSALRQKRLNAAQKKSTQSPRRRGRAASAARREGFRGTGNIELQSDALKFDIRRPNHLAPFLVFSRYESSELGGRSWKDGFTPIGNGLLDCGIGEARIDRLVERLDDCGGYVLWSDDA